MTPFQLAWLSLSRRHFSTAIAIISIAISVATSGLLLRLYLVSNSRFSTLAHGFDAVVGAKAGGLDILLNSLNGEGAYPDFLPYRLYESLQANESVKFEDGAVTQPRFIKGIVPLLYFAKYKNYRILGTTAGLIQRPNPEEAIQVIDGRWVKNPLELVVGASVASDNQLKVGDTVTVVPWMAVEQPAHSTVFRIVGVLQQKNNIWDRQLYATVEQAQAMLANVDLSSRSIWKNQVLNYFLIDLEPNGLSALEALINRRTVGQVISVPQELIQLQELTGTGQRLGLFMTMFIMLLGGLAVVSMLVARFDGMTVQLAVLRAIGFGRSEMTRWLLWEGFLLGSTACLIGAIMDAMTFAWLRNLLGSALPDVNVVSSSILQSAPVWLAAIVATMLAVVIPLLRIFRQNIQRALN